MIHNETRVSNERLEEMIGGLTIWLQSGRSGGPDLDRDTLMALTELQALRSTPVEAEPVAWINARLLRHHIETGNRQTTAVLRREQGILYGEKDTPLYSHPLPNPSPSDGEVITWECKDYADGWIPFNTLAGALEYQSNSGCIMRPVRALQSKRGQP